MPEVADWPGNGRWRIMRVLVEPNEGLSGFAEGTRLLRVEAVTDRPAGWPYLVLWLAVPSW